MIANFGGNGAYAPVGLGEEFAGFADSQADDIFVGRDAGMPFKGASESGTAHILHPGQGFDGNWLLERAVDIFNGQQGQAAFGIRGPVPARKEEDFPQGVQAELSGRVIVYDKFPEELPEAGDDLFMNADMLSAVQGKACGLREGAGFEAGVMHPEIDCFPLAGIMIVMFRLKDNDIARQQAAVFQKHFSFQDVYVIIIPPHSSCGKGAGFGHCAHTVHLQRNRVVFPVGFALQSCMKICLGAHGIFIPEFCGMLKSPFFSFVYPLLTDRFYYRLLIIESVLDSIIDF